MQEGLHESLITRTLDEEVNRALHLQAEIAYVDEADQTHVLTRHIANAIGARLGNIRDPVKRLIAANEFLLQIEQQDLAVLGSRQRAARVEITGWSRCWHAVWATTAHSTERRCSSHQRSWRAVPRNELRAELDSADSVDLLCAFVMWRGVRLLERELAAMKEAAVPLRVVTTTYIGGTEREALDRLVRNCGAEVKVSTTPPARAYMQRHGYSIATPVSTRRTSAHPTSRPALSSRASSGMFASRPRRRQR